MKPRDYRRGLALGELLERLEGLERRLAATERRATDAELRVDELSRSLAKAWRKIESLERTLRGGPTADQVALIRAASRASDGGFAREPRRVPAVHAARRLGVTTQTVRRLVEAGDLEGLALQLPDRARKVWVVELASVERLERAADAVGAVGAANPA